MPLEFCILLREKLAYFFLSLITTAYANLWKNSHACQNVWNIKAKAYFSVISFASVNCTCEIKGIVQKRKLFIIKRILLQEFLKKNLSYLKLLLWSIRFTKAQRDRHVKQQLTASWKSKMLQLPRCFRKLFKKILIKFLSWNHFAYIKVELDISPSCLQLLWFNLW